MNIRQLKMLITSEVRSAGRVCPAACDLLICSMKERKNDASSVGQAKVFRSLFDYMLSNNKTFVNENIIHLFAG